MLFKDRHLIRVTVMWGSVCSAYRPAAQQWTGYTRYWTSYWIYCSVFWMYRAGHDPDVLLSSLFSAFVSGVEASSRSLIIITTFDFLWHDLLTAALPWRLSGPVQDQVSWKTSRAEDRRVWRFDPLLTLPFSLRTSCRTTRSAQIYR